MHSRRGSVVAPVRFDPGLRRGLAFLTVHFHDQVATNELTIDAVPASSLTPTRLDTKYIGATAETPFAGMLAVN